ncbi:MAG TPA: hypothetical protein VNN74_06260 [Candidatus Micrarchaeia archaeon]|nr:hypothetical protein [Candidatus Micrarchaeia archaeon]
MTDDPAGTPPDVEERVAWTATPYHAPVLDRDGGAIGTTESLLGDEASDIFHGLAVRRHGGEVVELAADRVERITRTAVHTSLGAADAVQLPAYRPEHWFHLGWGGLFRKRPEWEDS